VRRIRCHRTLGSSALYLRRLALQENDLIAAKTTIMAVQLENIRRVLAYRANQLAQRAGAGNMGHRNLGGKRLIHDTAATSAT
jgi:hypothetical protein